MVSVIFSEMVWSGFCSTESAGLLAVLLDMFLVALVLIEQPFTFALAVFATVLAGHWGCSWRWLQALAFGAEVVPVGLGVVAAVTSVIIAPSVVVLIITVTVSFPVGAGASTWGISWGRGSSSWIICAVPTVDHELVDPTQDSGNFGVNAGVASLGTSNSE